MYMKIHVSNMLAKGVKYNSQTNTTNNGLEPATKGTCTLYIYMYVHQYIHVNEFTYSVTDVSVGYLFLTASPIRFSKSLATKLYHSTVGHVINVS